jgi:predicted nucleotidyltransferase component of viral defense system
MPFSNAYRLQVQLLVRTLPLIVEEDCFGLKGGTAINLFIRDMPRLSVDIDLTYLPVSPRAASLAAIDAAMRRISARVVRAMPAARVTAGTLDEDNTVNRLFVKLDRAQTQIEVTPVLRGCVFDPELRSVSAPVEEMFGFAEARIVSFADLYAGKIVAALDRQHPRDLFDIRDLLAREGIDDAMRSAFIVYMISHHRPMHEVLASRQKDIAQEFMRGFEGMTSGTVDLDELYAARNALIIEVVKRMPDKHRRFLIGFEKGEPDWNLLALPNVSALPAIKWRQQNLDKLKSEARAKLVRDLELVLLS